MAFIRQIFRENSSPSPTFNRWVWIYLVLLLLAGLKLGWHAQYYLDLLFHDETEYMYKGLKLASEQYNNWGPSYNGWYFLLSFVKSKPVELFYFNYKVIMVLVPMLLFLFLFLYGVNVHVSMLMALSYLMMALHTANFTLVSHFCLVCLLLGFIATRFIRKNEHKLVVLIAAAYVCMYARQEFLMIVVALIVLWLAVILFGKKIQFSFTYIFLAITITGLFLVFGFISFKGQGVDRSYFAFMQYFYANYVMWTRKVITPDAFFKLDLFNGAQTMFQCLVNNPALFLKHISTNFILYFSSLFKYFEDFFLPKPIFHYFGKIKHILFVLVLIALLYQLVFKKSYRYFTEFIKSNPAIALAMLVFFGWSFFSIFMIYPNRHYIVMQFFWYLLIIAYLFKNYWVLFDKPMIQVTSVLLFFIFVPTSAKTSYFESGVEDRDKQPNLEAVNYLVKHNNHKPAVVFTAVKGFYAYLPSNYKELFPMKEDTYGYFDGNTFLLRKFLEEQHIDVIFMNERMQDLIHISDSPESKELYLHPENFGFHKVILSKNLKAFLLIRNEES